MGRRDHDRVPFETRTWVMWIYRDCFGIIYIYIFFFFFFFFRVCVCVTGFSIQFGVPAFEFSQAKKGTEETSGHGWLR